MKWKSGKGYNVYARIHNPKMSEWMSEGERHEICIWEFIFVALLFSFILWGRFLCLLRISQVINIRRRPTLPRRQWLTDYRQNKCVCMFVCVLDDDKKEEERKKIIFCEEPFAIWLCVMASTVASKKDTFLQKNFLAKNHLVFYRFWEGFLCV